MPKTAPGKHVTASTLVLAAIRERVAALHAVLEPGTDPEPVEDVADRAAAPDGAGTGDDTDASDGGTSVTVPAASDEVPDDTEPALDDDTDDDTDDSVVAAGVDLEALAEALADLEAAVTGFARLIEGDDVVALRAELAWARAIVEESRALDGTVELLEELTDDLDPALRVGPVRERLRLVVTERTAERRDAVTTMLDRPEFARLVERADRVVLTAPIAGTRPKHTAKVLAKALTDADEAARQAADAALTEAHETDRAGEPSLAPVADAAATVAVTARVTRAVHGKKARKLADAAEAMVRALDDRRRTESAAHWLVDLADLAHRAGEPGFSYGVLHAQARARREAADEALAAAVTAYTKPKLHQKLG